MPKTFRRTLIYKRARWVGVDEPPDPLSDLLDDAHRRLPTATGRRLPIGDEGNHRVANDLERHAQLTAGNLLDFTMGQHQLVLRVDDTADAYEINELAPADERSQFLEGQLFFGAWGNNVALIQSKSLRVGHLELYLSWLLTEASGILRPGARLMLEDQLNERAQEARRLNDVTFVRVRSQVSSAEVLHPTDQMPDEQRAVSGFMRNLLALRRNPLAVAEALAAEDYEVSFEVKRTRRGGHPRSVIDDLAEVVRDTDLDFELRSRAIGRLRRDDLMLSIQKRIQAAGNALRLADVREDMYNWLVHLIDQRRI